MKKIITFLLFVSVLLSLTTCKKKAVKIDPNFVGSWKQFGVYVISEITIPEKGKATHYGKVGNDEATHTGVAKIDRKTNELFIGLKKWHIDAYPYKEYDPYLGGDVWKMTLDDVGHWRPQ